MALPTDDKQRKLIRAFQGFVKYFPDAIAACANLSRIANEQHNPGQPIHWAKEKSTEELDSLMNHLLDIGSKGPLSRDADGVLDAVKIFWRAGANLQRLADAGVDIINVPPNDMVILDEASEVDWPKLDVEAFSRMGAMIRTDCEGDKEPVTDGIIDGPHAPTPEEIIDMERSPARVRIENLAVPIVETVPNHPGPWDVVFTKDMGAGLEKEQRRGPYETVEQAEDYARRNPEQLPGLIAIQPSTCKVREDHA